MTQLNTLRCRHCTLREDGKTEEELHTAARCILVGETNGRTRWLTRASDAASQSYQYTGIDHSCCTETMKVYCILPGLTRNSKSDNKEIRSLSWQELYKL